MYLEDDVALSELGTAWVVHDLFNHWTHWPFSCICGERLREVKMNITHNLQWSKTYASKQLYGK